MDETLRDLFQRHWHVLLKYINPTDNLVRFLVDDKVLPSTMIEDIKKGTSRREKNERLLNSIKLRGNTSYRKFRDSMMKCGQIFIADLLWEDEVKSSYIDESDLCTFPAFKLSLNAHEQKEFISFINAKVKMKLVKSDWKKDSNSRLELLQSRHAHLKFAGNGNENVTEQDMKICDLTSSINNKNDMIRTLTLELNVLNHDINNFLHWHQKSESLGSATNGSKYNSYNLGDSKLGLPFDRTTRFSGFNDVLSTIDQRLSALLGEPIMLQKDEPPHILDLDDKCKRVHALVRELEAKVDTMTSEEGEALDRLMPGKNRTGLGFVDGLNKFHNYEQKQRYALLKDIDNLSRKLRGMKDPQPNSGLKGLRQSAVTGNPSPDLVDYRFLSNHISLLEADADHIQKMLGWKDGQIASLQSQLISMRRKQCSNNNSQTKSGSSENGVEHKVVLHS